MRHRYAYHVVCFRNGFLGKSVSFCSHDNGQPSLLGQPWVVYPSTSGPDGVSLLTSEAISQSVSPVEVLVTIVLFTLIYLFIFVAYVRIMAHFIKKGPDDGETAVPAAAVAKDGE